eukprot:486265-Rhodomonas_salina.1
METEALMQKHNLSATRVRGEVMEGSPSKWKKQLMQASVHGEAVRTVRESIATESEAFALYVKTKAEWKADPDDPQVEYMYKRAQRNLQRIMERGELEFPDPLNLEMSSSGRSGMSGSGRSAGGHERSFGAGARTDSPYPGSETERSQNVSPASSTGGLPRKFRSMAMEGAAGGEREREREREEREDREASMEREERAEREEREREESARREEREREERAEREEREREAMEREREAREREERQREREREERVSREREREQHAENREQARVSSQYCVNDLSPALPE